MEINRKIIKKASFYTPTFPPHLLSSRFVDNFTAASPPLRRSVPQSRGVNLIKLRLYLNDRDPSRYHRARASKYASFKSLRVGRVASLSPSTISEFQARILSDVIRSKKNATPHELSSWTIERPSFSFESKTFRLTRL